MQATSLLFDNLLRRVEIAPPPARSKREFADDDPRLFKNSPAFQPVLDGMKRHLEACRPLTKRMAHTKAFEAAKLQARITKQPVVKPTQEVIGAIAYQIERTSLVRLIKKTRALHSRYIAHIGAKQAAKIGKAAA